MTDISLEIIRFVITAGITLLSFFLTWVVGQRIATLWAIRQKRKELSLSAANRFESIYGEFFSLWKLWDYYCVTHKDINPDKKVYWNLLNRACAAEAGVEAIMVKLSSECVLSATDIRSLGKFRQAFQTLRESIEIKKRIEWYKSDNLEYLTFKRLSTYIANMLVSNDYKIIPDHEQSYKALREITSNKWENNWVDPNNNWVDPKN